MLQLQISGRTSSGRHEFSLSLPGGDRAALKVTENRTHTYLPSHLTRPINTSHRDFLGFFYPHTDAETRWSVRNRPKEADPSAMSGLNLSDKVQGRKGKRKKKAGTCPKCSNLGCCDMMLLAAFRCISSSDVNMKYTHFGYVFILQMGGYDNQRCTQEKHLYSQLYVVRIMSLAVCHPCVGCLGYRVKGLMNEQQTTPRRLR